MGVTKLADPKLTYGMTADGRLVSVADVPRGLACGCRCAECGSRLVAKKGDVVRDHFAHEADAACAKALETTAHRLAKQVIAEAGWITVPALVATTKGLFAIKTRIAEDTRRVTFSRVDVERGHDGFRPDVTAFEGQTTLAIEVLVTHACPPEKLDLLKARGITAVEIDLSRWRRGLPDDPAVFADAVLSAAPRKWLFHARQAEVNEQFRRDERAEVDRREAQARQAEEQRRLERERREAEERRIAAMSARDLKHNLWDEASNHFGHHGLAKLWLKMPNPRLERKPPIDFCEDAETYRRCQRAFDWVCFEHIRLQSRYANPNELMAMVRLLSALSRSLRWRIWSIFCDSKETASYTVEMRRGCDTVRHADPVAAELHRLLLEQRGGYNWLKVGPIEMDSAWEEPPAFEEDLAPVLGTLAVTQADSTSTPIPPWQRMRVQRSAGMPLLWDAPAD